MELIKLEIKTGRDLFYYYSKLYHTLTDIRFWLALSLGIIWLYMFGV